MTILPAYYTRHEGGYFTFWEVLQQRIYTKSEAISLSGWSNWKDIPHKGLEISKDA